MSRPHADALPEWPGGSGTRDYAGREWLYADHGHRDGMGRGALAAPEHTHAVVSGSVWPGECAPPENRDCGASAEVTDRTLALPEDGRAPSGSCAQGGGVRLDQPREQKGLSEKDNRSAITVWGWCGPLVGGHGFAARTDYEEGWSTPGFTGAQSACRIGCVTREVTTDRRSFGARELHGSCSHQHIARDTLPSGLPQGL
jgi:hypothetical protein